MTNRPQYPDDYPPPEGEVQKCPRCECRRAKIIGAKPQGAVVRFRKRCEHCGKTYCVCEVAE